MILTEEKNINHIGKTLEKNKKDSYLGNFQYIIKHGVSILFFCCTIFLIFLGITFGKTSYQGITLKKIELSYPQKEQEDNEGLWNWIKGLFTTQEKKEEDVISVKLAAIDVQDPQNNIAYFKRYYYPKDDPKHILQYKITSIPETVFSLPKKAGEYMFGVQIYDKQDHVQSSEEIIGEGPILFIPPSETNPDIPIVTLRSNKDTINIGETVIFEVIAKTVANTEDFKKNKIIYYDFDGDGTWDLTTKKDRVTHRYEKQNEIGYYPRVAVEYKGFKGENEGREIIVRKILKPTIAYNIIGNYLIIRDLNIGDIKEREICFEKSECEKENKRFRKIHYDQEIVNNQVLEYQYENYGTHTIMIQEKSKQGLEGTKEYQITTIKNDTNGKITSGVNMITIPEISIDQEKNVSIFVNKKQNNKVVFYVQYRGKGTCFIDTDISDDSDLNGNYGDDKDILCNKAVLRDYEDKKFDKIVGRVFFEINGKLTFKSFTVELENSEQLTDDEKMMYKDITRLMQGIELKNVGNANLNVLLDKLRKNLSDKNATSETAVEIQKWINTNIVTINEQQDLLLQEILDKLIY